MKKRTRSKDLRALSDSDRLSRPDASRPCGHRPRLRLFRLERSSKGSLVVETPRQTPVAPPGGTLRPVKIAGLSTYVPPHVLDEPRSRKAGRNLERMDPPAHRHPRAPHRRARRRDVGPREGSRHRRHAAGGRRADRIGFIVVGTTTPDTIFPWTACVLQHKIGATKAWGFDLGAACSGSPTR